MKIKFKKKLNHEDEELQKIFKNLFASNIKRIKHQEKVENPYHIFHGQIRSRFNTKFLRENKNWLR